MTETRISQPHFSISSHFDGISHACDQVHHETARLLLDEPGFIQRVISIPGATHFVSEIQDHLKLAKEGAQELSELALKYEAYCQQCRLKMEMEQRR